MTQLTCFKEYDIRGKLGDEINEDVSYRIGYAFGQFLNAKTVVIGGDARLTSEGLKSSLADGLLDAGVNVLDLGMVGTEEVYFATYYLGCDGGIEITASHNPIDYNGMKLVRKGACPVSAENGLRDIKLLAEHIDLKKVNVTCRGDYKKVSTLNDYASHILKNINLHNIKPLRLVINSGNGAAGHVIDELEKRFFSHNTPIEIIKVNHEADGNFPNGIPNPLLPECREDTRRAVIECNADMGIAFDGDFDRCFFFDEKGNFIEGYYIVGLLAEAFLKKNPGQKIIHDPRLTWNTIDMVSSNGGIAIMSKTGHAYIKERMRQEDAIYGGEMSAHHYFRDFAYCDSGMIPWLLIAELVSVSGKSLGQLVQDRIQTYPSSGEINSKLFDSVNAIKRVLEYYQKDALSSDFTDGITLEFIDWRFNLRTSNTEPVVRLNVESRGDIELMKRKTKEILLLLRQ